MRSSTDMSATRLYSVSPSFVAENRCFCWQKLPKKKSRSAGSILFVVNPLFKESWSLLKNPSKMVPYLSFFPKSQFFSRKSLKSQVDGSKSLPAYFKRSQEIAPKNTTGGPTANGRRRHGFHGEGAAAHLEGRAEAVVLCFGGIGKTMNGNHNP